MAKRQVFLIARETDNEAVKGWQKKVAEDMEAYKAEGKTQVYDSLEYMSLQYFFRFSQAADPELLYDLVSKSKPTKEWLGDLKCQPIFRQNTQLTSLYLLKNHQ